MEIKQMNREAVVAGFLQEVQERYTPPEATLQEAISWLEEACNEEKYSENDFRFQLGLVKFSCEREHSERPLMEEHSHLYLLLEQKLSQGKQRGYYGRLKELEKEIRAYRQETKNIATAYFERRGKVLH
ncbi:hypothetical protein HYX13_01290 [Candidatus Woesearchaeota archaeon]|nr:hypothetical protein [Candidatus Woesearchaeota archaeon]